jgi:hypothetical protein
VAALARAPVGVLADQGVSLKELAA